MLAGDDLKAKPCQAGRRFWNNKSIPANPPIDQETPIYQTISATREPQVRMTREI